MKLDKAVKNLGPETVVEMEAMDEDTLKKRIVEANQAMEQVQRELDENESYQELKESLKAVTAGKKEVNKRQNSVITLAIHLLESKGT